MGILRDYLTEREKYAIVAAIIVIVAVATVLVAFSFRHPSHTTTEETTSTSNPILVTSTSNSSIFVITPSDVGKPVPSWVLQAAMTRSYSWFKAEGWPVDIRYCAATVVLNRTTYYWTSSPQPFVADGVATGVFIADVANFNESIHTGVGIAGPMRGSTMSIYWTNGYGYLKVGNDVVAASPFLTYLFNISQISSPTAKVVVLFSFIFNGTPNIRGAYVADFNLAGADMPCIVDIVEGPPATAALGTQYIAAWMPNPCEYINWRADQLWTTTLNTNAYYNEKPVGDLYNLYCK
ncbi:MAG: hypothetical protein QXP98_01175 [Thermoproteus sp.]